MPYTNQLYFSIKEDDIVFDIGGHMGNFALYASLFCTNGQIHVFEPINENFKLLEYNIGINKKKNIIINNVAVGNKNTTIDFLESQNDKASHSKFKNIAHGGVNVIKVKQVLLDQYIGENNIKRIDFLKMDCEGAEYEILYNLPDECFNIIEKISMEIHDDIPGYDRQQMMDFLVKKGFIVEIREVYINVSNIFAINKNYIVK